MPTMQGEVRILILWKEELRAAAASLRRLLDLTSIPNRTPAQDDAMGKQTLDALNACIAALHGADRDEYTLVLSDVKALAPQQLATAEELRVLKEKE